MRFYNQLAFLITDGKFSEKMLPCKRIKIEPGTDLSMKNQSSVDINQNSQDPIIIEDEEEVQDSKITFIIFYCTCAGFRY